MKLNLKKKLILMASLLMLAGSVITSITLAADKVTVYVFCADWNAKCREAVPSVQSVAGGYAGKVGVEELNIDLNITPSRARALGLSMPSTIPYVTVLQNGKVVFQQPYTKQTPQQLKTLLDSISH